MVKSTRKPDSSGRVTYYADTVGEAVTLERDYIHVGDRVFAKTADGGVAVYVRFPSGWALMNDGVIQTDNELGTALLGEMILSEV